MTIRNAHPFLLLCLLLPFCVACLRNAPITGSPQIEPSATPTPWVITPSFPPTQTSVPSTEVAEPTRPVEQPTVAIAESATTQQPTPAPPTIQPTTTPLPPPTPFIDRTCTAKQPPTYRHFWLPNERWPIPQANPRSHLWLSRPLPYDSSLDSYNEDYPYGWDGGRAQSLLLHNGLDISRDLGKPVLAAASGTIVDAGDDQEKRYGWRCDWYGNFVVIQHDEHWEGQPIFTLYGHVLNINVEVGQRVERGEQVAEVGVGGAAKVRHLHFEVRVGENRFSSTRNPLLWLEPAPGRVPLIGRIVSPSGLPWQGVPIIAVPLSKDSEQRRTWTYLGDPDKIAIPDEHYAENFVLGDMQPGDYTLFTTIQGVDYNIPISIWPDQINTIEIVTESFKTPTPGP